MNSPDPWRMMRSSPSARRMIVPPPYYQYNFIGAEIPATPKRSGLTAEVAPVLAPATGGFTAKVELDDKQHLHAAICIDGKCYKTSIDLAPAIALLMTKIAQMHTDMHASMPAHGPVISGDVAIGCIDHAVGAAGDALIDTLVDRHCSVACAGWLDDIGNAIKGAGTSLYHGVSDTVQKLKDPIKAAAAAAATAYGGPAAGGLAAQLIGPIVDTAANLGKDTPQKAAAEQAAKTDPTAAAALTDAKNAVAHTVAAFHVTETAKQAAAGHPVAQQQIAKLTQDAEKGDPAAHAATDLVSNAFSSHIAARRTGGPGGGGGPGTYPQHASRAVAHAQQRYQQQSGRPAAALGYLRTGRHHQKTLLFNTLTQAQNWYMSLPAGQHSYAAVFDGRNLTAPIAENFGGAGSAVSGWYDVVGRSQNIQSP